MFFSKELSEVKWLVQVTETCSDVVFSSASLNGNRRNIHTVHISLIVTDCSVLLAIALGKYQCGTFEH